MSDQPSVAKPAFAVRIVPPMIAPCPPKTVLFDLDNTLWSRDAAVLRLAAAQHAAFAELASVPLDAYVHRLITVDDRGRTDKGLMYQQIVSEFDLPGGLVPTLRDHFWDTYQSFCTPAADAVPVLKALRGAGIKTGIITNGTVAVQDQKIVALGLDAWVDVILVSEREGVRKPEAEMFFRAVDRLSVEPRDAWFVGDHPDADVRGAAEAGMTAVLIRTWVQSAPDAT